jgi:hypothetical protein
MRDFNLVVSVVDRSRTFSVFTTSSDVSKDHKRCTSALLSRNLTRFRHDLAGIKRPFIRCATKTWPVDLAVYSVLGGKWSSNFLKIPHDVVDADV